MSTPYMLFAGWGKSVAISIWVIWASTFILSRAYAFHEAYIAESQRLLDERYLLEKCQDPEFYSNIRQHTGICAEVETNSRSSTILKALNIMAQGTHVCGIQSCAETLRIILGRMTWQAIGLLALASLVFPNALMVTFRVLGLGRNLALEKGLMRRHAMRGVCYERDEAAPFYCDMNEEDSNLRKRWPGSCGKKSV